MNVNGTDYHHDTPPQVVNILERFRNGSRRLRLTYGNGQTGKSWGDFEVGYIGRSVGRGPYPKRVPLMISNARSRGGPAIQTHCVVRIEYANKRHGGVLYQHPTYQED